MTLDLKKTALVVIDLQTAIAKREGLQPVSGDDVIARNNQLAAALKNTDALIDLVRVKNQSDEGFNPVTDKPWTPAKPFSAEAAAYEMAIAQDDTAQNVIKTDKHNWGAFYGTDLDVQLRRRGIDTIILTGIATSIGVDTTAREAAQHGYKVILVPEAMADMNLAAHNAAVDYIFPRLGQIKTLDEVLAAIEAAK